MAAAKTNRPVARRGLASRSPARRPLWQCPRCGHWFVTRNLWHSCERIPVASHFAGRDPKLRVAWRALLATIRAAGPVKLSPNKTRIAIMSQMRFASVVVRADHLRCTFILARRVRDARLAKYEFLVPHYHLHTFRLERPEQLDAKVRAWYAESYRMGEREHLDAARVRRTRVK